MLSKRLTKNIKKTSIGQKSLLKSFKLNKIFIIFIEITLIYNFNFSVNLPAINIEITSPI